MTQPDNTSAASQLAAISAAQNLSITMLSFTNELKAVSKTSKKHQLFIRLLSLSMAFDIFLSIALGTVGLTAHQAAEAAAKNQKQFCLASNETRKVQRELWTTILTTTSQGTTDEQEGQRAQFKAYIDRVFADRVCK